MININKEDGALVIKVIEEQLGQKLPSSGLLAGQSVASVLLYLKKKSSNIVINDYDIFTTLRLGQRTRWRFVPHTESESHINSVMSVNRIDDYFPVKNIETLKARIIEKRKGKFHINDDEEKFNISNVDYDEMVRAKVSSLYRRKNILAFSQKTNMNAYRIIQVSRAGLLNYVYVSSDLDDERNLSPMNIISNFDINCTQVAIDLKTKRIYFTTNFIYFLNSMQMILIKTNKPDHSFIRFMKKMDEHGYYGNVEHAAMTCSTIKALNERKNVEFLDSLDIYTGSKHTNYSESEKTRRFDFGTGYIDKFNSTHEMKNYADLALKKMQVKLRSDIEKNTEMDFEMLKNGYVLGTLHYKNEGSDYILSGKHHNEIKKMTGLELNGYIYHAKYNVANILHQEFKIGDVKSHSRRMSYITGRKLNVKTSFGFSDIEILNRDISFFKGSVDRINIDKISKIVFQHPGLASYFTGLTLLEMSQVYKVLKGIEKRNVGMLYYIELKKNIDLSVYSTPDEAIKGLVKEYQLHLEKIKTVGVLKEKACIPTQEMDGYIISELITQGQLNEESAVQKNCISNYTGRIKNRSAYIVSFRNKKNLFERCSLELYFNPYIEQYVEVQFMKKGNIRATESMKLLMKKWLTALNTKKIES